MHIDWWTLALQTINLLVLVWLLGRFLFRPVARIVEERQAAVDKALDDARSTRDEAEQARNEAKEETARIAAERSSLLDKAMEQADQEKAQQVADARRKADQMIEAAKSEIESLRKTEQASNDVRAGKLAAVIAARLFERLPDEARVAGFIDGLGTALLALPEQTRNEIGSDAGPVTVMAARRLSDAEHEQCRKAIAAALGRDIAIEVAVKPELIAGLEVETPHATVRNSFRADLDRITRELAEADAADG